MKTKVARRHQIIIPEEIRKKAKIAEAYKEFKNIEGFTSAVSIEEIKNSDYNLNVTLYVFPEEKQEEIDASKEWEELRRIEEEKIEGYLKEIK